MAKHDENKDLRSIARVCRVDYSDKSITYNPNTLIGIKRWGKIDFLVNYCGWHLYCSRSAGFGGYVKQNTTSVTTYARDSKRSAKEHKLTNKTKRGNNKRNN